MKKPQLCNQTLVLCAFVGCARPGAMTPPPTSAAPLDASAFHDAEPAAAAQQLVEEAFRKSAPPVGPRKKPMFPAPKQFLLNNGLRVVLLEDQALPIVAFDMVWDGGRAADPKGKEGRAGVCAEWLSAGTQAMDLPAWSAALGDIASQLGAWSRGETHGISGWTSGHADELFQLFSEMVTTPGFRDVERQRIIQGTQASLAQQRATPAGVAARVEPKLWFGSGHPLGRVITDKSLQAVTERDCAAWATGLRPRGATLFVSGAIDEATIRAAFATPTWQAFAGAAPRVRRGKLNPSPPGTVFWIHLPKTTQATVALFAEGPMRTATDYAATSLAGAVFGGSFSSRLNMNLREKNGYTYGARGGFSYTRDAGVFFANSQVRLEAAVLALIEMDSELSKLASNKQPVTEAEFVREQRGLMSFDSWFATTSQTRQTLQARAALGLAPASLLSEWRAYETLTIAGVQASLARLPADRVRYLVIGDGDAMVKTASGTTQSLRAALAVWAAGRGPLVELTVDGDIVRADSPIR